MTSLAVSRAARSDLKNIAAYTQKTWGVEQRRVYLKGLDNTFHFLLDNPLAGSSCDYIVNGLRKHQFESHTIFYEYHKDVVLIVRVLHKSMDVSQGF